MATTQKDLGIKIYSSYPVQNGNLITITYACIIDKNTVSTQKTITIEKNGGAVRSMAVYFGKN